MNTEILGIIVMFTLSVLLAIPLGKYIAKVYAGEKTLLSLKKASTFQAQPNCISGLPKEKLTWGNYGNSTMTMAYLLTRKKK